MFSSLLKLLQVEAYGLRIYKANTLSDTQVAFCTWIYLISKS